LVFPTVLIHFEPPKEDNLPTKGTKAYYIIVPNVSFVRKLYYLNWAVLPPPWIFTGIYSLAIAAFLVS